MKRYLCLLIAAMMLLSSCSNAEGEKKTDDTAEKSASTGETEEISGGGTTDAESTETEEETENLDPGLPEKNYGGEDFTFLVKGETWADWGEKSIWVESSTGDVLNDAVLKRNQAIEEKFGVKIAQYESADPPTDISNSVLAADGSYDVVMPALDQTGGLISKKNLVELHDVPYMNLEQPWYDQRSVADLSVANKLYMVSGDISTLNNDATWCTMINLAVLANSGVESPYELVKNNQWTMDKYYSICEGASQDLDGDGTIGPEDLVANLTQNENSTAMVVGAGIHLIDKDENDIPVYSLGSNERAVGAMELINKLMTDKNISLNYHQYGDLGYHLLTTKMFEENRGLFWITNIQMVIRLRGMETDFGIAPVPKYDEQQENYSNIVWECGDYICVPTTTNDLERTGIIIEGMSAKSREILRPAYYEVALSAKYLRDHESVEMLDLVFDNRIYEVEKAFKRGVSNSVDSIVLNGAPAASTLAKIQKIMDKVLDKAVKELTEVNE